MDRVGVRGRSKSCAARPREQGRHAVSEIRRAVSMKIAVKDQLLLLLLLLLGVMYVVCNDSFVVCRLTHNGCTECNPMLILEKKTI